MPTSGNEAPKTALPHPPNTNQNVPMNSAALRFANDMSPPFAFLMFDTSHRDAPVTYAINVTQFNRGFLPAVSSSPIEPAVVRFLR